MEQATQENKRVPSLFRNRDYMLLWSGQIVSQMGGTMAGIVFPLLILALTGSPFAAGIAEAVVFVPYVLLSLPVGALVDRWDRKLVMIVSDAARALAFFSIPIAYAMGWLTVWQLYIVALIEGTGLVFFNIAEVAALPRVVSKEQLADASAQNMATWQIASLAGPGLGGFLYKALSPAVPFLANAVSYTISVISLLFVRVKFQAERSAGSPRDIWAEIKEGLGWLWSNRLLRTAALLTGMINFISNMLFLAVILGAKHLGADEAAIGLIFSIGAVGGVIGAALSGRLQRMLSYGQAIIGCMWIIALTTPLMAAGNLPLLIVAVIVAQAVVPIYSVVQVAYRLPMIPDHLQGRVNSVFRLMAFGFQPLGAAIGGVLLQFVSPQVSILLAFAGYAVLALVATLSAEVRNAPRMAVSSE